MADVVRRILIAPDSFKGSLTASEACQAIASGVRHACAEAGREPESVELDLCPMADGGEGTALILGDVVGAERRTVDVAGPMEAIVQAAYFVVERKGGILPAGSVIIDSASAIGMPLAPISERDPMRATSRGLGQLLRAALAHDPAVVYIGLGGVATVDCGIGLLAEVGRSFYDADGIELAPYASSLAAVRRIEHANPGRAGPPTVVLLADVLNPLLGRRGALRVFGAQKGLSLDQIEELEEGFSSFARACRGQGLGVDFDAASTGAAGGLGFALTTIFEAGRLVPGASVVADTVGLDERLTRADLVITGEGRLDHQTSMGKVVGEVAKRATAAGVRAIGLCGAGPHDPPPRLGLHALHRLMDLAPDREVAIRDAAVILPVVARFAVRDMLAPS